jgi:hypothetical protein
MRSSYWFVWVVLMMYGLDDFDLMYDEFDGTNQPAGTYYAWADFTRAIPMLAELMWGVYICEG